MTDREPIEVRTATRADIDAIVATLTSAFLPDPLWGPVFPDKSRRVQQAERMWRVFVTSALRYPWTLVTRQCEAVALWIPPGGAELTPDEGAGFEQFIIDVAGRRAGQEITAIFEIFSAAHPRQPHFYLSLFGTHWHHRGLGIGMRLLAENLGRIDAQHMPAYLESSNPADLKRYAGLGFEAKEELTVPSGHVVTTMWRPAR